jgi:hypothetical protein
MLVGHDAETAAAISAFLRTYLPASDIKNP